jgi:uncharacterized membrane protein
MRRSLGAAIAVVFIVMSALIVVRWNVWSFGTDTGTFAQIALNAGHGFTDGPEFGTHFHFHWSPILAVLWPIVALTRSPLSIQIVQVLLIALSAVPLAAIVRTYAGERWALRVGVLALIYPPLLSIAFEEFHELAFYPVLALGLLWAADRARWLWFTLFAIPLVLIREDVCIDLIAIGIALAIIGIVKRRGEQIGLLLGEPIEPERLTAAGFGLAVLSAAALAVYITIVVPRSGGWAPAHFYHYPFAEGPVQTALAVFTHPYELARAIFTFGRFTYLLEAFAPLAFLPLFTRWTWLAVPGFAGVLLASDSLVWRMGNHYSLLWSPWLLLAAAWALVRIERSRGDLTARRWWTAAVTICAIVLIAFNPMHPAHYLTQPKYQDSRDVVSAFACVPRNAPIATHDEWYTHMALTYPNVTNIGDAIAQFHGYIVYTPEWGNAHVRQYILPQLSAEQADGRYSVACKRGNVIVLRPKNRKAESRAFRGRSRRSAVKG